MKKLQFLLFLTISITRFASINSMDQSFTTQQNIAKKELADILETILDNAAGPKKATCRQNLANFLIDEHGKTSESLDKYMRQVKETELITKLTILAYQTGIFAPQLTAAQKATKERIQVTYFTDQDRADYNRCKHDL